MVTRPLVLVSNRYFEIKSQIVNFVPVSVLPLSFELCNFSETGMLKW